MFELKAVARKQQFDDSNFEQVVHILGLYCQCLNRLG